MARDLLKIVSRTLKDKVREKKAEETREENIGWLSILLDGLGDKIVKGLSELKQPTPQVTVNPPEVNVTVPEVKVPEIKIPQIKIPQIPEAKVTVDIPEIKVPDIKIPEIKVPQPKVTVNVEKPDTPVIPPIEIPEVVMPDEMKVSGGDNPLPVTMVDSKGKPMSLGGGSSGGSGNAGKMVQTQKDVGEGIVTAIGQSKDFYFKAITGQLTGISHSAIGANNPDIDSAGGEETIWPQGGLYTYLSTDTTLYVSSSSVADTGITVVVAGWDSDYNPVVRLATMDGQNQAALNGTIFRVAQIGFLSANAPVGDVWLAESDSLTNGEPDTASKIKAKSLAGRNAGFLGMVTVPAGKTAYFYEISGSVNKGKDANVFIKFKLFGQNDFTYSPKFNSFQGTFDFNQVAGTLLPEKTDIEFSATTSDDDASVTIGAKLILIDNE